MVPDRGDLVDCFVSEELLEAVLSVSRVAIAIVVRSLSDIADDVTLAQLRTLVALVSQGSIESCVTGAGDRNDLGHYHADV
jgi:hypothetical protein